MSNDDLKIKQHKCVMCGAYFTPPHPFVICAKDKDNRSAVIIDTLQALNMLYKKCPLNKGGENND